MDAFSNLCASSQYGYNFKRFHFERRRFSKGYVFKAHSYVWNTNMQRKVSFFSLLFSFLAVHEESFQTFRTVFRSLCFQRIPPQRAFSKVFCFKEYSCTMMYKYNDDDDDDDDDDDHHYHRNRHCNHHAHHHHT